VKRHLGLKGGEGTGDRLVLGTSAVPTVVLVGERSLPAAPEFLRLGAVVVVAPDRDTLEAWQYPDPDPPPPPTPRRIDDLIVDLRAREVRWRGQPLDLTQLEFRLMALFTKEPERAWSFDELRAAGWGPGQPTRGDLQAVRSLVQRLRRKLRASGVMASIPAVRGFGFRLSTVPEPPRPVPELRRSESKRS
jgi:DNA-binding winged helix-turn-helix (wHTH) protein